MPNSSSGRPRPRILLVEDHADTRLMYGEFLGPDYEVLAVGDGVAALEALEGQVPQIIVTDLALPRLDGFELIARVRGDVRFASIPIIALSGYSGAEHDERMTRAHPITVLQKPCLPETLVEEVEKNLRGTTR